MHYSAQSTATSYLNNRRPLTYLETKPTPTQSPSATRTHTSQCAEDTSPGINRTGHRKSVKFDRQNMHNGSQLLEPWTIDIKPSVLTESGADTMPLIESNVVPVKPPVQ